MTDGELVRIARQINTYQERIHDLVNKIANSDRPDAAEIVERLWENEIYAVASAEAIVHDYLQPGRWVLLYGGYIYHVSSRMAKANRDASND